MRTACLKNEKDMHLRDDVFRRMIASGRIELSDMPPLPPVLFDDGISPPAYLNEAGEAAGVNFSQVLQDGLKNRLNL